MGQVFEFGPFRLDDRSGKLLRADHELHLTAKAYATLSLLVERAGSLVSKDEILAQVWPEGFVEPANLTQTIYVLRKTLSDSESRLIETLPGRGYRFTANVRRIADEPPKPVTSGRAARVTTTRSAVWSFPLALVLFAALTLHSSMSPQVSRVAINPQAQRNYILGRHYWSQRTESSLRLGLKYFKAAISLAPKYAQAYSGVADSYSAMGYYGPMGPQKKKYFELSRDAALQAIAIDPNIAEPHASLAFVDELSSSHKSEISTEFQRSIELDNSYATAHEWYAWYLYYKGRHGEALDHMKQARNLDPTSPVINFALGYLLFFDRQFNEAAEQWHQTIAIEPYSSQSYLGGGLADEQLGNHQLALTELRHALSLQPNDPDIMGALAYEYARARQPDAAGRLLSSITKMRPIPAFDVALVNEGLGQRTQAVKWLAIAEQRSQVDQLEVAQDPRLDDLRHASVGSRYQNTNG